MITGSLVAIVTPMKSGGNPDGALDLARFRNLIDWHVAEGTDGIVVVGTTGESPTVDFDEHKELIRVAVEHSRGRIPVIAGSGGHGVISVTANVAPKLMHQMCAAALVGDVKKSRELNDRLLPLHQRLFLETNPSPVKWAMAEMGLIEYGLRLPMVPLSEKFHQA